MNTFRLVWTCLRLVSLRIALRDWLQYSALLGTMAIALAGYLSIEIATRSAVNRFQAVEQLTPQQGDWVVRGKSGFIGLETISRIRRHLDNEPVFMIPVLEQNVLVQANGGQVRNATLLVSDLYALNNFSPDTPRLAGSGDFNFYAVYTSNEYLETLDAVSGDTIQIQVEDTFTGIPVNGLPAILGWPARTLLLDYPAFQQLSSEFRGFDRIELFVEQGPLRDQRVAHIGALLMSLDNDSVMVESGEDNRAEGARLTQSFRYNLKLLTFIALLAAAYLLMQVMDTTVTRRRREISILRSLGLSRRWIENFWILESFILGLLGSTFGILLSVLFSRYAYLLVDRTVSGLYRAPGQSVFNIGIQDVATGYFIGMIISLGAGWWAARHAAQTPPAQILARGDWSKAGRLNSHYGIVFSILLLGGCVLFLPTIPLSGGSRFPLGGILAALFWMAGGGGLAANLVRSVCRFLKRRTSSPPLEFALSRLAAGSSRYSLATAGLFVATAMAASVLVLVSSLDQVLRVWMNQRLQADFYVISDVNQESGLVNAIQEETWQEIINLPQVEAAEIRQGFAIYLESIPTFVGGTETQLALDKQLWLWLQSPEEQADVNLPLAYISESFSLRFQANRGDTLTIPTPSGAKKVFISGVYTDYGNERGTISLDRKWTQQWFNTNSMLSLSLYTYPDTDRDAFYEYLSDNYQGLTIRETKELHDLVLQIFRDTFAVTELIQAVALFIAVSGLALALVSMILDSRTEWYILRELGMSRSQVAWVSSSEGLFIATIGGLLGLLASYPLGWLLIQHINKPSFGWSMPLYVPWTTLFFYLCILILTGLLIGFWIGRETSRKLLRL